MNPNGPTQETEYVFRRLGESFPAFASDLRASSPLWLVAAAAVAVAALLAYRHFTHAGRTPRKGNAVGAGLGWLVVLGGAAACGVSLVNLFLSETSGVGRGAADGPQFRALDFPTVGPLLAGAAAAVLMIAYSLAKLMDNALVRWSAVAASAALLVRCLANAVVRDGGAGGPPVSAGGVPLNLFAWYVLTGGLFALAVAFVVAMYVKDAHSVRWYWAVGLATLRISVYAVLLGVFLLPATQVWERTEKRSRVLVLLDVSPSLTQVSDDVGGDSARKPQPRIQKVIDFLTDEKVAFVQKLTEQNPVHVYRFGTRLDEETATLAAGDAAWAKAEWDAFVRYDFKPWLLRGLSPEGRAAVKASPAFGGDAAGTAEWAGDWLRKAEDEVVPAGLTPADVAKLKDNRGKLDKRVDVAKSIALGTNAPDSITGAINRESANMVQGLVVFTDGRSNLGSDSSYAELKERATREKIPVFTVAVGEDRQTVSIVVTDVVAPDRAPPDEPFKIVVEADGVNLANQEVDARLGLYLPGRDTKKDAPDHELTAKLTFAPGDPPHGQAEFVIDPTKLPDALTEEAAGAGGKRRQLKEGAWAVVARIAKDKREAFPDKDHVRERSGIQVLKKPLRVLMVASGPTREYQTLKTLLVREVGENRAELSIFLQNEAVTKNEGKDIAQDVPPERLLSRFPTRLDTTDKSKPEERFYNLNEYDLIIAFDPDWSELSEEQVKNVQTWIDNLGGGLIYVAGTHHTFQLARAEADSRLSPILNVLPVIPEDIIVLQARPIPRTPRRLYLKPTPDSDVLNLEEGPPGDNPTAGWEKFFTNRERYAPDADVRKELNPARGFYSAYPVKQVKPGAAVLAEFAEFDEKGDKATRPWLVTAQPARGRTAFLASGDTNRLRAYDPVIGPEFYQRFWVKLARYVSANRDVKAARGRVLLNKEYVSGSPVRVQARLLAPNGQPYPVGAIDPKFRIVPYTPAGEQLTREDPVTHQKIKVEFGPYQLVAKKGAGEFDGYYAGQVVADARQIPPGDTRYRVVMAVPDSPGDTLDGEFMVRKSDPELDNPRPDTAALLAMAGEFDDAVRGRVRANDPRTDADKEFEALLPKEGGKPKLAFRLADPQSVARIPLCLRAQQEHARNRGAVTDLWDQPLRTEYEGRPVSLVEFLLTPDWLRAALTVVLFASVGLLAGRAAYGVLVGPLGSGAAGVSALAVTAGAMAGYAQMYLTPEVWEFDRATVLVASGLLAVQAFVVRLHWGFALTLFGTLAVAAGGGLVALAMTKPTFSLPVSIGFVLFVIVGLLSLEWLTRKLLRLA